MWYWGDATGYTETTVPTASHTFAEAGEHTVTLRIMDNYGSVVDSVQIKVTVSSGGTSGATGKLNDTGITWWANASTNGLTTRQDDFPGQDADSGRTVTHKDDKDEYRGGSAGFNYTKIGANGETLPVVAENWSAVLDNVTGLMWEMKTDDGGLHDKDNTYTWYEPVNLNGGSAGTQNGGTCPEGNCDTYSFVRAVNAGAGYCGKKDWRMPTRMELHSIVNHGTNPIIDTRFFPNTQASGFFGLPRPMPTMATPPGLSTSTTAPATGTVRPPAIMSG